MKSFKGVTIAPYMVPLEEHEGRFAGCSQMLPLSEQTQGNMEGSMTE